MVDTSDLDRQPLPAYAEINFKSPTHRGILAINLH